MALFRSREKQAGEAIAEKLAAARSTAAEAEAALHEKALEAALSPDPWAAEPQHEALRRARERVELLEHALVAADVAERQRQAEARAKLRTAQDRAIRQHLSALLKAGRDYQKYAAWRVEAFDKMVDAGKAIRQLLPSGFDGFESAVSYGALRRACEDEDNRAGVGNPGDPASRASAPGTVHRQFFHPLTAPPMAAELEERLLRLYDMLVGKAPPPVEPPPQKLLPPPAAAADPAPKLLPPPPPDGTAALVETPQDIAPPPFNPEAVHGDDPEARADFLAEMARFRRTAPEMPNTAAAEIPPPQAEEVEPAAEAPTPPAGRDARNWRKNHRPRLAETPAEAPALEMTDAG